MGTNLSKRGVYLLPAALTTGNIFCGFYAITAAWAGDLDLAAKAVGIAIVLDGFDGRIARLIGATSQFGVQLDSLADAISFGLAPSFILWGWHLKNQGYIGWIACFVFLVCGIMRLARFNVQSPELKHFLGLPIPAAAGMVAALAHFHAKYLTWEIFQSNIFPYFLALLAVALGMSMVSTVRYASFKSLSFRNGRSHMNILIIALAIAGVWFFSQELLMVLAVGYFLSGYLGTARRRLFPKTLKNPSTDQVPDDAESS